MFCLSCNVCMPPLSAFDVHCSSSSVPYSSAHRCASHEALRLWCTNAVRGELKRLTVLERGIAPLREDERHHTAHNAAGRHDVGCIWRLTLLMILFLFSLFVLSHVPFRVVGFFFCCCCGCLCPSSRVLLVRACVPCSPPFRNACARVLLVPSTHRLCVFCVCYFLFRGCFERDLVSLSTPPFFALTYLWTLLENTPLPAHLFLCLLLQVGYLLSPRTGSSTFARACLRVPLLVLIEGTRREGD